MRRTDEESVAWSRNVDALRMAIVTRKPDAISRVELQRQKLQHELGLAVSSLAVMQARERGLGETMDQGKATALTARIELLQGRLTDLRAIMVRVRSAPLPDNGATPETAARPALGCDIPESLMDAATDLKCGWAVRTSGLAAAVSNYDELRTRGEPGKIAEKLERQYTKWHAEMTRQRMMVWPVALVVLEGRSTLEAARLRKADPRMITHLVCAGLILYQVHAAA